MKENFYDTAQKVVVEALANTHTILVAKIVGVGETTIDCKPVLNRVVNGESIELAIFPEVPPVFMQGGSSYTAHPITEGDYCLLLISERCFDTWYSGADFVKPADARMFDYSDAFALVGVNPMQAAISIPEIITSEGDRFYKGDVEIEGDVIIEGDLLVTGEIKAGGEITAMFGTGNDVSVSTHLHTANLGAPSSPPTPGT